MGPAAAEIGGVLIYVGPVSVAAAIAAYAGIRRHAKRKREGDEG